MGSDENFEISDEETQLQGERFLSESRFEDAVASFQLAVELNPDEVAHWFNLARAYRESRMFDVGLAAVRRAIELDDSLPECFHALGNFHRSLWRFPEAIAAFQRCFLLDPDFMAHNNLGLTYCDCGQYEKAVNILRAGIAKKPNSTDMMINLAIAYRGLGRSSEAAEWYWRAAETDPTQWAYVAGDLRDIKDYERAIQAGKNAIAQEPRESALYQNLGNIYKEAERFEEAIEQFERGLREDPKKTTCLFQIGRCALQLGRPTQARDALLVAAGYSKEDGEIRLALADAYFELGDHANAAIQYRAGIELTGC
jgi:tetratricopeptide (TPR) repeat protein